MSLKMLHKRGCGGGWVRVVVSLLVICHALGVDNEREWLQRVCPEAGVPATLPPPGRRRR